jgi:dTDP-4-dehydrorhamnose reductase
MGVPLLASPGSIEAITTSEYNSAARRPASSRLDTSKFSSVFGLTLPGWENGIDTLLGQLVPDMLP